MDSKPETAPIATPGSAPGGDWPSRAADLVDTVVALVRDKTVRPITLVARALVFGIVVLAASVVTVALVSIALVRLLTVYAFQGRVWASDLLVGALFVVVGMVAWSQRTRSSSNVGKAK